MNAAPGASFEAVADLGATGLSPGVQVIGGGVAVVARTTAGIAESPANTYTATLTAPATAGKYTIVWDTGAVAPNAMALEDLWVPDDTVEPGTSYESVANLLQTGLAGTAGVEVTDDATSAVVVAHFTAGIAEFPAVSGIYWTTFTAPATGTYTVTWDNGAGEEATEPLVVTGVAVPTGGPCQVWVTADEVAECCSVEASSSSLFDVVAQQASDLLFTLSGRQFTGLCGPRTVRPPCDSCWCGYQVLSRGHIVGPWDHGYPLNLCDSCLIACSPSMVKLAGYPVREITQVLVDGDVLSADEYGILNSRYLYRKNDGRWPITQDLTLPDTEDGTWSVSYTYGADPPALGMAAAAQLACELYKACSGASTGGGSGDCVLPTGVTRITRQGVTIDRLAFTSWSYREGRWATGLALVDAFMASVNPAGLQRRPVLWSPGKRQYAQEWN